MIKYRDTNPMRRFIDAVDQARPITETYGFLRELEQLREISGWRKGLATGALALSALAGGGHSAKANDAIRYYNHLVDQMTEISQTAQAENGDKSQVNIEQIRASALKSTQAKYGIRSNPDTDVNQSLANPAYDDWGNPTQPTAGPDKW